MKKLALLCLLIASPAFAHGSDWTNSPGAWVEFLDIKRGPFDDPFCSPLLTSEEGWCASMAAMFKTNKPTCLRFENPYVVKDGRRIPGIVEEKGVPGEPGWEWLFRTTEEFWGEAEFHVRTVDVCPKVG